MPSTTPMQEGLKEAVELLTWVFTTCTLDNMTRFLDLAMSDTKGGVIKFVAFMQQVLSNFQSSDVR